MAAIIAMLLLFSQIRNVGFDSGFSTLGIQDDVYIEARKVVDQTFHRNKKIIVEVIPENGNFNEIVEDMNRWEEQLKLQFDTVLFKSWIKAVPTLYSKSFLESASKETVFKRFSEIELFANLVGGDLKSFLVILEIPDSDTPLIINRYEKSLKDTKFNLDYSIHETSSFHLEESINRSILRDIKLIITLLFGFFILVIFWAYRSFFAMFYLVFNVILALFIALAVHMLAGEPLNLITILVLPVVIVLAAADAIHLLTGFFSQDNELSAKDKIKLVYQKYFLPSLLTSITTSVAFFSLMFNNTKSVFTLGWITGISVVLAFLACFTISPWLFGFAKHRKVDNHRFTALANFFINRKKMFSYLLVPVLLLALVLLPQLTFKNNFEIFIPTRSEAKTQHDIIRANYSSSATMDILMNLPDSTGRKSFVRQIQLEIQEMDHVDIVKSSQTKSMVLTKFMIPVDLAQASGYAKRFSANEGKLQRLQIGVKDPNKIIDIEIEISKLLKEKGIAKPVISSSVLAYNSVNREVGKSLIQSLLSSSIFLFLVFFLLTRSGLLSAIGLFANLVPLSLIVIIFVGFDLHINIMTAMTAVVCLGIIVDDMIHSFYRRVVLREKLKELSFGMVTTTLVLTVGFGVFSLSDVTPVMIFGSVASVVFVITLICDFTLLLYFIDLYDRFSGKSAKTNG